MAYVIVTMYTPATPPGGGSLQLFGQCLFGGTDVAQGQYPFDGSTLPVSVIVNPGESVATVQARLAQNIRDLSSGIPNASGGVGVTVAANAVIQPGLTNT